jgi:hypothetical protein
MQTVVVCFNVVIAQNCFAGLQREARLSENFTLRCRVRRPFAVKGLIYRSFIFLARDML